MSVKKTSRTLMAVGLSAVMSAALAKTQVLDDSETTAWDGSDIITGEVTKSNVLSVTGDATALKGLSIEVANQVENAVNFKTDGSASCAITMEGPLAVQTHAGCDTVHLLFGNGGEAEADEPSDVNLDWGMLPIDIRLMSNSVSSFANLKGHGLTVVGNGGTTKTHRTIGKVAGGIDVGGGDVLLDGAVLEWKSWVKESKAAYAGGRGLNNATGQVVCRNRGGLLFDYQPMPSALAVRMEHGGVFGFKEGNWEAQVDKAAGCKLDVIGSGTLFYYYSSLAKSVRIGGLKMAPGSILYVPNRGESLGILAPSDGVKVVGGDGSTPSRQPIVPGLVRTQAAEVTEFSSRLGHLLGTYTYDADARAFLPYPGSAWSTDWESATTVDNVKVNAALTLGRETVVNAILSETSDKEIDCGGNALQVVSGFCLATWNNQFVIKNGTLKIGENPIVMVANVPAKIGTAIETAATDREQLVFAFHGGGFDYKNARIDFTGDNSQTVGRFYFGRQFMDSTRATFAGPEATSLGMVLDTSVGTEINLTSTWEKPKQIARLGGLAGCGKLTSYSTSGNNSGESFFWVPTVVVGDDSDSPVVNPDGTARKVYVCKGGFIAPGELTTEGTRVGTFTIEADQWRHLNRLEFAEGGELRIHVEGLNSTSLAAVNLTDGVQLGGTLTITESGKVKGGVPYTILTSTTPISGAFASVTTGWKTAIVENKDGTYALTATKSANGFSIIIR